MSEARLRIMAAHFLRYEVTDGENDDKAGRHEGSGRHQRTRRETRKATNSMAAGAAVAQTRPKPDQEAGNRRELLRRW